MASRLLGSEPVYTSMQVWDCSHLSPR
jgi:hypothetical protein